jgi:hypothetical protein
MLARCQFGCDADSGSCGATLTYPIKGYPWRRNVVKHFSFEIDDEAKDRLFNDVSRIRLNHAVDCLATDDLWSDFSEKANSISRDRVTGTLCYTIGIYFGDGTTTDSYSLRENSEALLTSVLYKTVARLIAPYEWVPDPAH